MIKKDAWRIEIEDLILFWGSFVLIFLTWIIYFNWNLNLLISSNDSWSHMVIYKNLLDQEGDYLNNSYILDIFGGAISHQAYGAPLIYRLFTLLKTSPFTAFNYTTIIFQTLWVFLGIKSINGLVGNPEIKKTSYIYIIEKIFQALILAFMPIISWRLNYSHQSFLMGLLLTVSIFSLTTNLSKYSITLLVSNLIAICASITSIAPQTLLASLLFSSPVIILLTKDIGPTLFQKLKFIFLLYLVALFLSMPSFWGPLESALTNTLSRNLTEHPTYDPYLINQLKDLLASIFFSLKTIPLDHEAYYFHEAHYPIGIFLLSFFLVLRKNRIAALLLFIAFLIPWIWGLGFIEPFSIFKSFRVPTRAILPTITILFIIGLSRIEELRPFKENQDSIPLFIFIFIAGHFIPIEILDIGIWIITLLFLYFKFSKKSTYTKYFLPVLCGIILTLTLKTHRERMLELTSITKTRNEMIQTEIYLKKSAPELNMSLNRVITNGHLYRIAPAFTAFAEISSLDGYWLPPKLFLDLEAGLRNEKLSPSTVSFIFTSAHPGYNILRHLYNITHEIGISQSGMITISKFARNPTPAWFSSQRIIFDNPTALYQELISNNSSPQKIFQTQLILKETSNINPHHHCVQSEVLTTQTPRRGPIKIQLEVDSKGECPLTISTNFFSSATIYASKIDTPKNKIKLQSYPAYGALLGTTVPLGRWVVDVEAHSDVPLLINVLFFISCFGSILFLFFHIIKISRSNNVIND